MKKTLLFIICSLFLLTSVHAQVFTITPGDSLFIEEVVSNNNDEVPLTAYVKNDSSVDLTFRWRVISNASPASWSVSFCDNTNCLDIGLTDQSTFLLEADSTSILKMLYLPFLEDGISDIEVQVSVDGVPGSATIKYRSEISADPTSSIRSIDTESISIYPNPAVSFIQVRGIDNVANIKSLEVYSIIGKKMLSKEVSNLSDLKVDVQNLDNGVYLVKLFDETNSVFYTKTFIKK
jgi:hypothetical protein